MLTWSSLVIKPVCTKPGYQMYVGTGQEFILHNLHINCNLQWLLILTTMHVSELPSSADLAKLCPHQQILASTFSCWFRYWLKPNTCLVRCINITLTRLFLAYISMYILYNTRGIRARVKVGEHMSPICGSAAENFGENIGV